jgi:NADH dehydrogenase FAD-containing subunit
VLATLELADVTDDPDVRRALLTFLAAGGGYAGVEGLGQLVDFVRKALRFYPSIRPEELHFILASHGTGPGCWSRWTTSSAATSCANLASAG